MAHEPRAPRPRAQAALAQSFRAAGRLPAVSAAGWVCRPLAVMLAVGLMAMALGLVGRRVAGQLIVELRSWELLAAGVAWALAVAVCRWELAPPRSTPNAQRAWGVSLLAGLVWAAALWPSTRPLSAVWLLAPLAFEAIVAWPSAGAQAAPWAAFGLKNLLNGRQHLAGRRPREGNAPVPPAGSLAVGPHGQALADDCVERWQRRQVSGCELVEGQLVIEVPPGLRSAVGHVAFCPPLVPTPQVEVSVITPPGATARVDQRVPHGARFEVRLSSGRESATRVRIKFFASTDGDGPNDLTPGRAAAEQGWRGVEPVAHRR